MELYPLLFTFKTIKEAKHGLDVTGFLKYKDKKAFFDGQIFFISILTNSLHFN